MQPYGLVSIGSHTGAWLQNEFEKFKNTKNILVEPVPYNLKELKQRISNYKNIIIEESAISDKDEKVSFYFVKRDSIGKLKKHWSSGIGSFDKSHLLNHRSKRFLISETDIEEITINCLSFSSLVKKYAIKSIQKLMLDIEGAEYPALLGFFENCSSKDNWPTWVQVEQYKNAELNKAIQYLFKLGYKKVFEGRMNWILKNE